MDTKWKVKKIKSFIYRVITVGAFFTMLYTGIIGREAFINLNKMGERALTGNIYYLDDFREYINNLFLNAMNGYAGLGDDNGFPLTAQNALDFSKRNLEAFSQEIEKNKWDIYYYIDMKGMTSKDLAKSSNIDFPLFSEYDGHLLIPDNMDCLLYWNGPKKTLSFFEQDYDDSFPVPTNTGYKNSQYSPNIKQAYKMRVLFALDSSHPFSSTMLLYFQKIAQMYQFIIYVFFGASLLFFVFGIFTIISYKNGQLMWMDYSKNILRIWSEIKIICFLGLFYFSFCYNGMLYDFSRDTRLESCLNVWIYSLFGIYTYLLYKDMKLNGLEFWNHSMIGCMIRFIRDYFSGIPWYRKLLNLCVFISLSSLFVIATGILLAYVFNTFYFLPIYLLVGVCLLFICFRIRTIFKDVYVLGNRLHTLRENGHQEPINFSSRSLLSEIAKDLDAIEDGITNAVEQQNRSNRMRVELITNVSHDLKTPLTSIINYADLLCEEALPAPACEYATALQSKAYRLKHMVQDVFALSKATSGNLTVNKSVIDLAKLLKQTLADMDERIQESNLAVKLVIYTEPIFIEADGEKLYRVFQNLILNALQYSLENSRIYIQLSLEDNLAIAKIKNISRQEINFEPDEIVERFVRADSSRTTEGSGLGLSIAQSFTEACGGSFHISTDADMFTACVIFPFVKIQNETEDTNTRT